MLIFRGVPRADYFDYVIQMQNSLPFARVAIRIQKPITHIPCSCSCYYKQHKTDLRCE